MSKLDGFESLGTATPEGYRKKETNEIIQEGDYVFCYSLRTNMNNYYGFMPLEYWAERDHVNAKIGNKVKGMTVISKITIQEKSEPIEKQEDKPVERLSRVAFLNEIKDFLDDGINRSS